MGHWRGHPAPWRVTLEAGSKGEEAPGRGRLKEAKKAPAGPLPGLGRLAGACDPEGRPAAKCQGTNWRAGSREGAQRTAWARRGTLPLPMWADACCASSLKGPGAAGRGPSTPWAARAP
jgi:hypothetical protein